VAISNSHRFHFGRFRVIFVCPFSFGFLVQHYDVQ
jgi:hypothetical protein